jgi:hypothetical protein
MRATKLVILAPLLTSPAHQPPKEPHFLQKYMAQTPPYQCHIVRNVTSTARYDYFFTWPNTLPVIETFTTQIITLDPSDAD